MFNKILNKIQLRCLKFYILYLKPVFTTIEYKVECPFCGWKGEAFLPYGVKIRPNAKCPKCGSLERHRYYYLFLENHLPTSDKIKVLHFAPEDILTNLFISYENIEYISADLNPTRAMRQEDIKNTSFKNDEFDVIFCSHVLEHIDDDIQAMSELRRILKPHGYAILQVPIKDEFNGQKITETYEDPSVVDPKEREKVFGQKDHVRIYGRDYKDRLIKAGFDVSIIKMEDFITKDKIAKYALIADDDETTETEKWIYLCTPKS